MQKLSKAMVLIILVFFIVGLMAGCGSNNIAVTTPEDAETISRTITDSVGRQVTISSAVEKIVPLGNTPRMIVYLGLADKVVGIGGMNKDTVTPVTAYAYVNKDRWADIPLVGTDAQGATDYYPEQIISVQPDVILCSYTAELAEEIQTKTGIPVVAVPMGTLFESDYEEALLLLGEVCGVKDRAEEVIAYINANLTDLKTRTADVPNGNKPAVLGAAATFKGLHGIEGVYTKYAVFEAINANDVTKGISEQSGGVLIDKEQVIGWNPQYIFLDSGGVGLVKNDYEKNPDFYAHLRAVKNNSLYQYPSSTSYYSNPEISLVNSYYAGSILYPEQFEDVVFADRAAEIFEFFLGDSDYLSKLEAAGAGYGKVRLGNS
ncbi:MAG: ABC transporter substrate-binding protein [Syntrophomonadaceae bacterium]|nr:ABC transporter substrate-binding protein [Syntrophomonadaceae bacterium]